MYIYTIKCFTFFYKSIYYLAIYSPNSSCTITQLFLTIDQIIWCQCKVSQSWIGVSLTMGNTGSLLDVITYLETPLQHNSDCGEGEISSQLFKKPVGPERIPLPRISSDTTRNRPGHRSSRARNILGKVSINIQKQINRLVHQLKSPKVHIIQVPKLGYITSSLDQFRLYFEILSKTRTIKGVFNS